MYQTLQTSYGISIYKRLLTCLNLLHLFACSKSRPGFPRSYDLLDLIPSLLVKNRAGNKSSPFASVLGWSYCLCLWFETKLFPLLLNGSVVRLYVSFGLPLFLFPSGVQLSAMCGWELASILSTWPIHYKHIMASLYTNAY